MWEVSPFDHGVHQLEAAQCCSSAPCSTSQEADNGCCSCRPIHVLHRRSHTYEETPARALGPSSALLSVKNV